MAAVMVGDKPSKHALVVDRQLAFRRVAYHLVAEGARGSRVDAGHRIRGDDRAPCVARSENERWENIPLGEKRHPSRFGFRFEHDQRIPRARSEGGENGQGVLALATKKRPEWQSDCKSIPWPGGQNMRRVQS